MQSICMLYAFYMHLYAASGPRGATRTAFFWENQITHPGATCNLPHNWSFLRAFYMHLYAASGPRGATRTAFFLENHRTHPGATCNLPHNWSFLHAFYRHSIRIYKHVICSL